MALPLPSCGVSFWNATGVVVAQLATKAARKAATAPA
jgi:hypothetical protein